MPPDRIAVLYTFLALLKKITDTQASLVNDYLVLAAAQGGWPKLGQLNSGGGQWEFRKHGTGVCFTNLQTKEEIDAHTGMEQFPHGFDEWRLEIYFSSIDRIVVEIDQKRFDLHSDQDIKHITEYLRQSNKIVPIPSTKMYELI